MKKIVLVLSMLVISNVSFASGWTTVNAFELWPSLYDEDRIRLLSLDAGYVYIPEGCASLDSYIVQDSLSEGSKNRIYSTLLMALTTKRPVDLFIVGCDAVFDRPVIQSIRIR